MVRSLNGKKGDLGVRRPVAGPTYIIKHPLFLYFPLIKQKKA